MDYLGSKSFTVKKQATNCSCWILILDATIDNNYILINSYNASNKHEQINTLTNLQCMLKGLNVADGEQIVFIRDFNLFFDVALETTDGKPCLKHNTFSELLEMKSFYDL